MPPVRGGALFFNVYFFYLLGVDSRGYFSAVCLLTFARWPSAEFPPSEVNRTAGELVDVNFHALCIKQTYKFFSLSVLARLDGHNGFRPPVSLTLPNPTK